MAPAPVIEVNEKSEAQKELRILGDRKKEAEQVIALTDETLSAKRGELADTQQELVNITRERTHEERLITDYNARRKELGEELDTVNESLVLKTKEVDTLEARITDLQNSIDAYEATKKDREDAEGGRIATLFAEAEKELTEANKRLSEVVVSIEEETPKRDAIVAELAKATEQLKTVSPQIEEGEKKIARLTKDISSATFTRDALAGEVEILSLQVKEATDVRDKAQQELEVAKEEAKTVADQNIKDSARLAEDQAAFEKTTVETSKSLGTWEVALNQREDYIRAMFEKQGLRYQPFKKP